VTAETASSPGSCPYPNTLKYTEQHEWLANLELGSCRFGITSFATEALGDVVYVALPEVGQEIFAGVSCGEVESTKSVSEIYAPVSGKVVAVNSSLADQPELINADPYGVGWLVEVVGVSEPDLARLLTADQYSDICGENAA
jgi:glycine cleavage system H protein